jgi:hypothetical protein
MEEELNRLASEMFRVFARFEYALKAAGFHIGNENEEAKPDWRSFAESVPDAFKNLQNEDLKESIRYIKAHPPKKQVIQGGNLAWSDVVPATNLESDLILLYVRRVRNNLFHGGKFNGRWFDPERSKLLLRHCLTILNACLDVSPSVREAYTN